MTIIQYKPTSPGQRHKTAVIKKFLCKKGKIVKRYKNYQKKVGRSSFSGHITVRHKGGGNKKSYRRITNYNNNNIYILVTSFYDPNRNVFIALRFNLINLTFDFVLLSTVTTAGTLLESERQN
jgi:large subunit ribosomal protein L2